MKYKGIIIHLCVYLMLWLSMNLVHQVSGIFSLSFPFHWTMVFFPALCLGWREGMVVTLICALSIETQHPPLRGAIVPLFTVTFLWLQAQKLRGLELSSSRLLVMASLSHIVLVGSLSIWVGLTTSTDSRYLLMRTMQDWAAGQLLLFLLLPGFWLAFSVLLNRERRFRDWIRSLA